LIWVKQKWSDFESFVEGVLYDRDLSISARLFGLILNPFSYIFYGIVWSRLLSVLQRFSSSYHPAGLFGYCCRKPDHGRNRKTPVVERLARELQSKGKKVAVLSRGYKSKEENSPKTQGSTKVVSDGHQVLLDSEEAGDEPFMLAHNLPGVIVLTDKDRVRAGKYAIKEFGVDVLILG
jgi:tetraacyldisaccharide 4'-kinase